MNEIIGTELTKVDKIIPTPSKDIAQSIMEVFREIRTS